MSNQTKKSFTTLNRAEVPYDVDGKEYVLVQASALATRKFREAAMLGTQMEQEEGGKTVVKRIESLASVEAVLISHCLFLIMGAARVPVPMDMIDAWPGDILADMFATAKEISPWLVEADDDVASLKKQREKIDKRIAKFEGNLPKS